MHLLRATGGVTGNYVFTNTLKHCSGSHISISLAVDVEPRLYPLSHAESVHLLSWTLSPVHMTISSPSESRPYPSSPVDANVFSMDWCCPGTFSIQIMVMDPCHLIHLPVVSVQSVCAECVQRVIVIVNTCSNDDSES